MACRALAWGPDTDFFLDQNPVSDSPHAPLFEAGSTAGMTERAAGDGKSGPDEGWGGLLRLRV
jgi:hypothetical protein